MKKIKLLIAIFSLCLFTQWSYAFNAPTNDTLTLRLINHSSQTLTYTGVRKTNIGNVFFVTPTVIFPGGAAIIVGTTTPYTDLVANLSFQDKTHYTHLLHINDPRMINLKQPIFSIYNDKLISFVTPLSLSKNENQDIDSVAYSAATVVIENAVHADKIYAS
jgi:hypothetical protein